MRYLVFIVLACCLYQFGVLTTFIGSTVYLMYLCQVYNTMEFTLTNMYRKYIALKSLAVLSNNNKYVILATLKLFIKSVWHGFLCYMNNTVSKHDANTNCVNITDNGKMYSFLIKSKKTPDNILQVIDQEYNDITDKILPFLRFREAMVNITPKRLGYTELQILTIDGDPVDIKLDETIVF